MFFIDDVATFYDYPRYLLGLQAREEAFGKAEAELRMASVVAVSASFPGLPNRPVTALPVSVQNAWTIIERVHEIAKDFEFDRLVPKEEQKLLMYGHLRGAVASLRDSEATWVSYFCADAFLPLAVNFFLWQWTREMPQECIVMFMSMSIIYPGTSGEALCALAGRGEVAQVRRCSDVLHASTLPPST